MNKLKWTGDLESLKLFLSDELNVAGRWESPSGGSWQFSSGHLTVTWYTDSKTILFQGPQGSETYSILKNKVEEQVTTQDYSTVDVVGHQILATMSMKQTLLMSKSLTESEVHQRETPRERSVMETK